MIVLRKAMGIQEYHLAVMIPCRLLSQALSRSVTCVNLALCLRANPGQSGANSMARATHANGRPVTANRTADRYQVADSLSHHYNP